jgi:hypothetical protein
LLDSVSFTDGGATDLQYEKAPIMAGLAASRIVDGVDTDVVADWRVNDPAGEGLACCSDQTPPAAGFAFHTPGKPNQMAAP